MGWDQRVMTPSSAIAQAYQEKISSIFAGNIVAYFPLWDGSGTTITELAHGWNGTATNIDLTATGIGDGHTAASSSGTGYATCENASLLAAIPTTVFTLMGWVRITDSAVWSDSTSRRLVHIAAGSNQIRWRKSSTTNNRFSMNYVANAVNQEIGILNLTTTEWNHFIMRVDANADTLDGYMNGEIAEITHTGLGAWSGTPTSFKLFAQNNTPSEPWKGNLAHLVLLNKAITDTEARQAARIT